MHRQLTASLVVSSALLTPFAADAQVIGTFRWQLQPFCNVVSVDVTQQPTTFTLDGFDDQCGAGPRSSIVGPAFLRADGSIGIGLTTVIGPGATPVHVDAGISATEWARSACTTHCRTTRPVPRPLRRSRPI